MSFVGYYVQELQKAQPAVVLVIKRLRRRGHGFKYYPKHTGRARNRTQDLLSTTYIVCGRVPWLYQYWPGGFIFLWFYVQELPKAQPAPLGAHSLNCKINRKIHKYKVHFKKEQVSQ